MGVIIVSKSEWARGLDSMEDFLIFKAVWLPGISYAFRIKGKMREDWKKQEGQILLRYKRNQKKKRRGATDAIWEKWTIVVLQSNYSLQIFQLSQQPFPRASQMTPQGEER